MLSTLLSFSATWTRFKPPAHTFCGTWRLLWSSTARGAPLWKILFESFSRLYIRLLVNSRKSAHLLTSICLLSLGIVLVQRPNHRVHRAFVRQLWLWRSPSKVEGLPNRSLPRFLPRQSPQWVCGKCEIDDFRDLLSHSPMHISNVIWNILLLYIFFVWTCCKIFIWLQNVGWETEYERGIGRMLDCEPDSYSQTGCKNRQQAWTRCYGWTIGIAISAIDWKNRNSEREERSPRELDWKEK